jgi:hypothetical protein
LRASAKNLRNVTFESDRHRPYNVCSFDDGFQKLTERLGPKLLTPEAIVNRFRDVGGASDKQLTKLSSIKRDPNFATS